MSSKVYFVEAAMSEGEGVISKKSVALFEAGEFGKCFRNKDFTAVKVHIGEAGNTTYLKAPCLRGLVDKLVSLGTRPFITDTSTLYSGMRSNAIDHCILAEKHGFGVNGLGAPFIPPDGLFGTNETAVRINGELSEEVLIAYDIERCQSILSIAHFTGHLAACVGATLKTLGMGCASRKGKMRQHAALKPQVGSECTLCGECFRHCASDAITLGDVQSHIDEDKCVGCAECVAVCRFGAVKYDWEAENELLQKNVAEHAKGALAGKKGRAAFFNYLLDVTKDCDCFDTPDMKRVVEDIGILASVDPVAVDKAAVDMVEKKGGKRLGKLIEYPDLSWRCQLEHAAKIGLGSMEYELVEV